MGLGGGIILGKHNNNMWNNKWSNCCSPDVALYCVNHSYSFCFFLWKSRKWGCKLEERWPLTVEMNERSSSWSDLKSHQSIAGFKLRWSNCFEKSMMLTFMRLCFSCSVHFCHLCCQLWMSTSPDVIMATCRDLATFSTITPLRTSFKQSKQSISHYAGYNTYHAAGDCEVRLPRFSKHASWQCKWVAMSMGKRNTLYFM